MSLEYMVIIEISETDTLLFWIPTTTYITTI